MSEEKQFSFKPNKITGQFKRPLPPNRDLVAIFFHNSLLL